MGNLIINSRAKRMRTPEQLAEIERWKKMTDEDIDYSDIPPLTDEELARFKPARLREQKLTKTAASWVQFKYVADDNKFVPNFNSYNDVYSKSGGDLMQQLADQWADSTLNMHENPNGNFYLTQTGNTVRLRADDGIGMFVIEVQLDFDNMTYTELYKQWYNTVSGSFTYLKIGGTSYGSYNNGTISDLTDGFSEAYTVTINNQTYSVEFDSDNKIKKIGDADVANGKVTINSTEYNLSEDGKSIQVTTASAGITTSNTVQTFTLDGNTTGDKITLTLTTTGSTTTAKLMTTPLSMSPSMGLLLKPLTTAKSPLTASSKLTTRHILWLSPTTPAVLNIPTLTSRSSAPQPSTSHEAIPLVIPLQAAARPLTIPPPLPRLIYLPSMA